VLTQDRPIDVRPIEPVGDEIRLPLRRAWFRAVGRLPDDLTMHQAVLAYASDYGLLVTALQPHGIRYRAPGLQLASLDHSLWMHRPFRADEWLLYSTDSPVTGGARGFVRGTIHSRSGELVASVAQEGLIRFTTGSKS
jgi:acyl-CoA thioesterase-2